MIVFFYTVWPKYSKRLASSTLPAQLEVGWQKRGWGRRNYLYWGSSENHIIPIRWDSSPLHHSQWRRHILLRAKAQAESSRHAMGQRQWDQKSSHAFLLTHCLVSSHVLLITCSLLTMHSPGCFIFFLSQLRPGDIFRNNRKLKYTFSFV